MLKFIIISAIVTIAQSGDIDAYLGKTKSVAIFPKLVDEHVDELCPRYNTSLVNVECVCDGDADSTNVKLLAFKDENINVPEVVIAISIVNTEAEALEVLTKSKTCKCGENVHIHQVYKPINDKFYLQYLKNPDDDKEPLRIIMLSRYEETKTDVENVIQSIDELKTREYSFLCTYSSN